VSERSERRFCRSGDLPRLPRRAGGASQESGARSFEGSGSGEFGTRQRAGLRSQARQGTGGEAARPIALRRETPAGFPDRARQLR